MIIKTGYHPVLGRDPTESARTPARWAGKRRLTYQCSLKPPSRDMSGSVNASKPIGDEILSRTHSRAVEHWSQ
jgi:hypothetical protein